MPPLDRVQPAIDQELQITSIAPHPLAETLVQTAVHISEIATIKDALISAKDVEVSHELDEQVLLQILHPKCSPHEQAHPAFIFVHPPLFVP